MKVWVATWDVGATETGLEVFASKSLAVDAAIEYAQEMSLLEDEELSVDEARQQLTAAGELNFFDRQCSYCVCEHEVVGYE